MLENTLSIIKPDAVERNLEENIKSIFARNNLKILKCKKIKITKDEASQFYKVHQTKPFYDKLCEYLSSGPIIVMILEGENAIVKNREIMGATNPLNAHVGSIRRDYGNMQGIVHYNVVHGSDCIENAKKEIEFFFSKEEIFLEKI